VVTAIGRCLFAWEICTTLHHGGAHTSTGTTKSVPPTEAEATDSALEHELAPAKADHFSASRETHGVTVVEGEHPGGSDYAAELRGEIDKANSAPQEAGIAVRFIASKG
jgi:hypothetical protein